MTTANMVTPVPCITLKPVTRLMMQFDVGQVPSCERCHDCFFQWDDIINDLRRRIADLHSQTISLTQFYFSNYTVDEILLETNQLLADLQQANESLNTINLQENSLEELQLTIINVSLFHVISTSLVIIIVNLSL